MPATPSRTEPSPIPAPYCILHLETAEAHSGRQPLALSRHWVVLGMMLPQQHLFEPDQATPRDLAQALIDATDATRVLELLDSPGPALRPDQTPVLVRQPHALRAWLEGDLIPACPDLAGALQALVQRLRPWPPVWQAPRPAPGRPPGWLAATHAQWADAATPPEQRDALGQELLDAIALITWTAAEASLRQPVSPL